MKTFVLLAVGISLIVFFVLGCFIELKTVKNTALKDLYGFRGLEGTQVGNVNVAVKHRRTFMGSVIVFSGSCSEGEFRQLGEKYNLHFSISGVGQDLPFKEAVGDVNFIGKIYTNFPVAGQVLLSDYKSRGSLQVARDPQTGQFSGIAVGNPDREIHEIGRNSGQ